MISKGKLEKIAGWGQQVSKQVANLENKRMSIDDINQHKDLGTGSLRKLVFIEYGYINISFYNNLLYIWQYVVIIIQN